MNITIDGKRYLGAAIGTRSFVEQYVHEKVEYWVSCVCMHQLSTIARFQRHVTYCAFTHGLIGKWTNFLRTIPDVSPLLELLEAAITAW